MYQNERFLKGISLSDGIYVSVYDDSQDGSSVFYHGKGTAPIFGGRVLISSFSFTDYTNLYATLSVDGVPIYGVVTGKVSIGQRITSIVSHLNAIETHGISGFLRNYSESIDFLYKELKSTYTKKECMLSLLQDDDARSELIKEIKLLSSDLSTVLEVSYLLLAKMDSGLKDSRVVEAQGSLVRKISP